MEEENSFRVAYRLLEQAWRDKKHKNEKAFFMLQDLLGVMDEENAIEVTEALEKMEARHEKMRKEFVRVLKDLQKL